MSREELFSILTYDKDTGIFNWKSSSDGRKAKGIAGKDNGRGYLKVPYKGKRYSLHRLVFLYEYGKYPTNSVDHINGDTKDNRLSNLREATSQENSKNRKRPNTNSSGTIGVYFHKPTGKWQARIMVDGKAKSLGLFVDISEAINKRKEAEKLNNFHKNHGRNKNERNNS